MARYFDPDRAVDSALLPLESRDATDLDQIATEAEADTIGYYTRDITRMSVIVYDSIYSPSLTSTVEYTALGDTLGVFLRYYAADPSTLDLNDAEVAAFKLAMQRTIATVISWRLLQGKINTIAIQETREGRHLIKSMIQIEPFPPNWTRYLEPYCTLPPQWTL